MLQAVLIAGCNAPLPDTSDTEALFMVVDAGQGLSQFIVAGDEAILFDAGPMDAAANWHSAYSMLGRPFLRAIVISHRDLDHSGGLGWIDQSVSWSGTLLTGSREDTAYLRSLCTNWQKPITISTLSQGDIVALNNDCTLQCLWPPQAQHNDSIPVPADSTNFFSIVCGGRIGNCSMLMTGDIDSTAARELAVRYTTQLRSDILVVPHHGSAGSVCPLFYGYVRPSIAVLSFGSGNTYGHPSDALLAMLAGLGIRSVSTSAYGSLLWTGNGYYWSARF
jgi:competence protein ComEC